MRLHAFDDLVLQVKTRLLEKGPATLETLALELGAPPVNVIFALEMLSEGKEKCVQRVPCNMWAATSEYQKKKGPSSDRG
jgi:hypothetical protein